MKKKKPLLVKIIVFLTFISLFIQIPGYIILFGGPERLNELPPVILNLFLNTPSETLYLIAANQAIVLLAAICLAAGNQLALNLYFLSFGLQLGMHISTAITRHSSTIEGFMAIYDNGLIVGSLITPFLLMLYSMRLVRTGYLSKNESRVKDLLDSEETKPEPYPFEEKTEAPKTKSPLLLVIAIAVLLGFSSLDAALSIYDQRPVLGSFMLLLVFWVLGVLTLRGNHFAYMAVLLMSASLFITPMAAKLNAPDRILIGVDPFIATTLLLMLLTPQVRGYFKEQRATWYSKQNKELSTYSNVEPVFFDEKGLGKSTTEARFWRVEDLGRNFYVVFPKGVNDRGYELESAEQFHAIKKALTKIDGKFITNNIALTALLFFSIVSVGLVFLSGWASVVPAVIVGSISIPAALLILNAFSYNMALDRVASQVDHMLPTKLKLTALKVLELRNRGSEESQQKIKLAIAAMGVFIVGMIVLLTFTVTPETLEQNQIELSGWWGDSNVDNLSADK